MLLNFFFLKGLRYFNLKLEKLKYDWVLVVIICYVNVYLDRGNKLGWRSYGNRFVRGIKKGFKIEEGLWCLLGWL